MSCSPSLDGYSTDRDRTTHVLSSARSQSKAKEVYQTNRRESGCSRPSALSEASSGDRCSAPSLAMVMDAIMELRNDMEKLKKDRLTVSTEDYKFEGSVPVLHKTLESVSQASPAGFSGFRSPMSVDSDEGEEFQGAVSRGSVLLESAKNFGPTESVSEHLDEEVVTMVNHLFISGMREEDYKAIKEDEVTLRPSNCHALIQVDCNAQVLDALPAETRKADFRLREVGKDITKGATIVVKSLTVLDKVAHDDNLPVVAQEVAKLNGTLALLGNAHYRNNLTRRHVIKRDINLKYSHLCSYKAPMTGLLFGDDLSQATRQIEEADRLKSKFTSKKRSTFWTSNAGRFSGGHQRSFFGKAPSRGFSSSFQPYDSRRSTVRVDLRRSYPSVASTSKNLRGCGQHNPRH
ncbi:hypothetical protein E2C01_011177 [Portunus trituberculatus]|uniref:Uncharacterized protein n=1 Tax=Portunus trituberculatus TaxID=210409 RepID=A0A5B7DAD7_PORTR|nr:hypothetical protein [Portunus trituberculatus]